MPAPFTAVVTTGIYCRAGCPASPQRRNTRPYPFAAAAEAAGFRPCLRCRPDDVPEPGWVDAPELVCRALRAIGDGGLDDGGEDDLAARLGISARHLRRLFGDHVGATPAQVARSRRAHFARRLLDDTDLPMRDVARAAGFTTVRHMNRVVKEVFRFTPTELRARRRAPGRDLVDGGLVLRLPYREPLAWEAMLEFLAPRAVPGVESVDLGTRTYRRLVEMDGRPAVVEVAPGGGAGGRAHLLLTAHLPSYDGLVHLVAAMRRLFDLDADPRAIDAALARDPTLRPLVRARPGLRVPGAVDPLEVAVRAVLGQQVAVGRATALAGRLVAAYGRPVPGLEPLGLTHLFPGPGRLARVDARRLGVPETRAAAVRSLARAVGRLDAGRGLARLTSALRAVPGVGPWTAAYVAMRAFGERDAFPAGDLGIRRALGVDTAAEAAAAASGWTPWRAYGAVHLWLAGAAPAATSGTGARGA